MERQLLADYEQLLRREILPLLQPGLEKPRYELMLALARLPEKIRGYGHVKLANVVTARAQWKDLLDRLQGKVQDAGPVASAAPIRIKGVAEL